MSAGRRFADDLYPEDYIQGIPRRSAVSVSSPPEAFGLDDLTSLSPRSWAPAALETAALETGEDPDPRSDDDPPSEDDPPPAAEPGIKGHRLRRLWAEPRSRWTVLIALAVVLGLIAWIAIASIPPRSSAPGSPGSPAATPDGPMLQETQLLEPGDLADLISQATWTIGETSAGPTVSTGQPKCIDDGVEGMPAPVATQVRSLTASADSRATVLQVQAAYATVAQAETAYTLKLAQIGGCAKNEVYVTSGATVTGLADQSAGVTVVIQQQSPEHHTLLLTRTGSFINVFDVSRTGTAVVVRALATAAAESLSRQCAPAEGSCPRTPRVKAAPPPAAGVVGWLTSNDLPRVSAGAGRWEGTPPAAPNLVGSQCEAVDLNQMPGATSQQHRTYLLTDDPAAPDGFGVDEAQYTLAKASDAVKLITRLKRNFDGCAARTKTATVKILPAVKVVGADGKNVSTTAYTVTQRISASRKVTFRVGILSQGNRVTYLLANPSGGFDFNDRQWSDVVARAAQRASQAS